MSAKVSRVEPPFFQLEADLGCIGRTPQARKAVPRSPVGIVLSQAIGCWTLFWPAYALSLALGDLLTELWQRMAEVLTKISTRFVQRTFSKEFSETTAKR